MLHLQVDIESQSLRVFHDQELVHEYPVSTAANGVGETDGSGCTPRGRHYISAKYGDGEVMGTVYLGRVPTGEIYSAELARQHPDRDWILSRILWLSGLEPGFNRLGHVDTMHRYIYIHGTPDSEPMGEPRSHGCIRMRNTDVMALFDLVDVGTEVEILETGA